MLSMLIFAAAAASEAPRTPVVPTDKSRTVAPVCQSTGPELVGDKSPEAVGAQKLNALPNANLYQAVVRLDEKGCSRPSIVAYDIGGTLHEQR